MKAKRTWHMMDLILEGKVPRPKRMLIEAFDRPRTSSPTQHIDMSIYRVYRSSGFTLRGKQ